MRHSLFVTLLAFLTPLTTQAGDWPQFRGPDGTGHSSETGIPVTWSATENVKWKAPLPSAANGSPIVSNGRVFITSAADEGKKRSLHCFDRTDGKQLWVKTVEFDKVMPTHETNPYAGTTPASDGTHVVVWRGSAGLACYDFDGKELWLKDLGEFRHIWGYGTSPIIHDGKVILHTGPGKASFIAAYEVGTGKELWKTEEPVEGDGSRNNAGKYEGSWSTPVITDVDGKEVIVCSMSTRVNAYDPKTGKIVWFCEGIRGPKGDLAYTSPVICGDVCVAMGGFGGPAIGLTMGGTGNITEKNQLWRKESNPQRIGSGVFVNDHVFIVNAANGIVQCIEPNSGKVVWQERTGGGAHWGSLVLADGRLYGTDQSGTTFVFKPNPEEYEPIAKNSLREPSNSTPAISDGEIFIRTAKHLWCISE